MNRIYLITEDKIKTLSNLNDNVWGEYLTPAIFDAQEMGLQTILGSCLYHSLLSKVADKSITETENVPYKTLLDDYVTIYLVYKVIADLVPIIGVKLTNLGTVVSNDEHVSNLQKADRDNLKQFYQMKADFYARRIQEYLLEGKDAYVELDECACRAIKANLNSAASTGLFLGGARGRVITK